MLFGLLVLPAALVVCGRGIFWPMVPRAGDVEHRDGRLFARIGAGVARRPRSVAVAAIAFLLLASLLGIGSKVGLSQTQIFRSTPESVVGQRILASAFPAGSSSPVIVIADASHADEVAASISATAGVASISTTSRTERWVEYSVTLDAAPLSSASYATVDQLRGRLAQLPAAHAVVGGDDATQLDTSSAVKSDVRLIVPLILLIVLLVLLLLLRSVVAPILLVATVLATYFASLGISWWLFEHLFGYPALDTSVRLYAFLFLVALGVDYNIFLTARAREETERLDPADEQRDVQFVIGAVDREGFLDLCRELARRCEHECPRRPAWPVDELVQDRQQERGRLAASRHRASEDIAPLERRGNSVGLDGRRTGEA